MTDDLATLVVQTGGQLTGMVIHSVLNTGPSVLNLVSSLANPILWIAPYTVLGILPIVTAGIGLGGILITAGILK